MIRDTVLNSYDGRPVYVISNGTAGQGKAPEFVERVLGPLLTRIAQAHDIHETNDIGHAARIGKIALGSGPSRTVIIVGGDGTAHEMIQGALDNLMNPEDLGRWELVVIPLGTANALFNSLFPPPGKPIDSFVPKIKSILDNCSFSPEEIYQLSSLLTSLLPVGSPRRLPITLTTLVSPDQSSTPKPIPSHVVLSTCLHAALLSTSETLRSQHPGLERFKIAAEINLGVFFRASVKLIPTENGKIEQYNPHTQSWVEPFTTSDNTLEGPFTYLLSSTTTPRLEPTFVISPLLARLPPSETEPQSMDLVILRPLRDPRVRAARGQEEKEEVWKARAREVLGSAYEEGKHVDLTYKGDEGDTEMGGEGEVVVECFRCGGFEWTPTDESHDPSHIVCADGSLHAIPKGGMAKVGIMDAGGGREKRGFYVWG